MLALMCLYMYVYGVSRVRVQRGRERVEILFYHPLANVIHAIYRTMGGRVKRDVRI